MLSIESTLPTNQNGLSIEHNIVPPPPLANSLTLPTAILDSGATSHFVTDDLPLLDLRPAVTPISVLVPNGHSMYSNQMATLDLPQFSPAATTAHVLPDMASGSLLSVGTAPQPPISVLRSPAWDVGEADRPSSAGSPTRDDGALCGPRR